MGHPFSSERQNLEKSKRQDESLSGVFGLFALRVSPIIVTPRLKPWATRSRIAGPSLESSIPGSPPEREK